MPCVACNGSIDSGSLLKCTGCNGIYHYQCLEITAAQFKENGPKLKKSWLCSFCTSVGSRRRRNQFTPVQPSRSETILDDSDMSCDVTLEESRLVEDIPGARGEDFSAGLTTPPNNILHYEPSHSAENAQSATQQSELLNNILAKVSEMQTRFLDIQAIKSEIIQTRSDIAELKNSLNTRFDEMLVRVESVESRVSALEHCKSEMDEVKRNVVDVMAQLRRNEQWVRRSNIQINGVPELEGENLYSVVNTLANLSGYTLDRNTDIDFVTRVAVRDDSGTRKPRPIIVKMQARYKKDDFISSLRKLRNLKTSDLGIAGSLNRIYINDHLSGFNKYLLREAKQRVAHKQYQHCWVRNCTVMVRKSDKAPVLFITSEEALNKIS